jgi:UDP-glucose:(heptosyl)LPS alpha-1,3-glucosyltransferase
MGGSRARVVIAISKKVKAEIERHYAVDPSKVSVVYHGVDLEKFSPAVAPRWRSPIRCELGLTGDDFAVLFVGGDYRGKGLLEVLQALDRLPPRVKIVAAGIVPDALLKGALAEPRRASRIRIVPPTSGIERYYAAADAFALPSFYDAFSMATLEAMAAGLPVVASSESGIAELLTDGVDGLIVPPGDVSRLTSALARLEAEDGLRRELAFRGRQTAEMHSWDRVADETRAAYAQAVAAPS